MSHPFPYRLFADVVLCVHFAVVLFVVGGLVLVVIGGLRGWRLARSRWFRMAHLGAVGVVVVQAWLGAVCPLTSLEGWLRERAGEPGYAGSFVGHWVQRLLYHEAEPWVFTLVYSLFALAVAATWWRLPPRPGR